MPGEIRQIMKDFFHALDNTKVHNAMHEALFDPLPIDPDWFGYDNNNERLISGSTAINRQKIDKDAPVWLNTDVYLRQLNRIIAPQFWETLLQQFDLTMISRMINAFPYAKNEADVARYISIRNIEFIGITLVYISIAIITGENFSDYVADYRRNSGNIRLINVGQKLGNYYNILPNSPKELLHKFEILFPVDQTDVAAIDIVFEENAFNHRIDTTRVCPAVKLTKMIFQEYGQFLQDQNYQRYFLHAITQN